MDSFIVNKLAEIRAFSLSGVQLLDRAGEPFATSSTQTASLIKDIAVIDLSRYIPDADRQAYDDKVGRTLDKLTRMMELYVKDEWGNPVEVMEWTGFYAGAGAAHAALAAAALEAHDHDLSEQLARLAETYKRLLDADMEGLRQSAKDRRQA